MAREGTAKQTRGVAVRIAVEVAGPWKPGISLGISEQRLTSFFQLLGKESLIADLGQSDV